jgi:carboxymethylenebutenolidase
MEHVRFDSTSALYQPPEGGRPAPGVVVLHEAFGLNDDIRSIAARFAANGYAALAPDLYSGGPKPICIARTVLDVMRNDARRTTDRVEQARRVLSVRPEVDGDRIGVIGFCLTGGVAVLSAARGDFQAASVNYGEIPEDPAALEGVCPVVASYGGRDPQLGTNADRLRETLSRMGVPHDVVVYPDAGHSFLNRTTPGVIRRFTDLGWRPEEGEHAWARIFAFFDEHLGTA